MSPTSTGRSGIAVCDPAAGSKLLHGSVSKDDNISCERVVSASEFNNCTLEEPHLLGSGSPEDCAFGDSPWRTLGRVVSRVSARLVGELGVVVSSVTAQDVIIACRPALA